MYTMRIFLLLACWVLATRASPFRVAFHVDLPNEWPMTLNVLDAARNRGVRVVSTLIEFTTHTDGWNAQSVDRMLTEVASRKMRWMPILSMDRLPASWTNDQAMYHCRNNHTLRIMSPWWNEFLIWHRYMYVFMMHACLICVRYISFAQRMLRHPQRFMLDRIQLSMSETHDLKHPSDGPCWFSADAIQSMNQTLGANLTEQVLHGQVVDNDMMQHAEQWYEQVLHWRVREQSRVAHNELDPLGLFSCSCTLILS
jgi:hypothetical protein